MEGTTLQDRQKKTQLVLTNIYNLPGRSDVMGETLKMLDNPNVNSTLVSKLICKDQAIATRILSIANSPLYGLRRKVSTIDFAIMVIGMTELRRIVIGLSIMESFKNKTDKYLDQKDFWMHSMMTATAAKRIAEDLKYPNPGEAFITGFLHDLGLPVMHKYFHSGFVEIFEKIIASPEALPIREEESVLGYNHQQIAGMLTEKWNLPLSLSDAIGNHHTPSEAKVDKTLAAIIHLADYMTQQYKSVNFMWDNANAFDESIIETLKFANKEELVSFIYKYQDLFKEEAAALKF